jgi:hypothetical protein
MDELIAKLEKATGPDRELDVAIVYALHPDIGNYDGLCVGDEPIFWHEPYRKQPCPRFTASIDAALSLVPEGMQVGLVGPWITTATKAEVWYAQVADGIEDFQGEFDHKAPTAALALCIAALRARAGKGEG